MSKNMVLASRIFLTLFVEEKYIWKLACLCCTGFLLIQILDNYLVTKPTVSSEEEVKLSDISFPDLVICLENGFDKKSLKKHGYNNSWLYTAGLDKHRNFIGWSGTNNKDPLRLVSDNEVNC